MKVSHKLIISYIGIILITSLLFTYFKKIDKIQEGAKGMPDIGKILTKGFEKEKNKITKEITNSKPVKAMSDFIKNIKLAFKSLTKANNNLDKALKFLFTQGGNDFKNIGDTTVNVAGKFFIDLWKSIDSALLCFKKIMTNIPSCFGFYVGQLTGYTLYYLFIGLPVYLIDLMTGGFLDIQSTIDNIFILVNGVTMNLFGDQVSSITNKCFRCKITPMSKISADPIKRAVQKMNNDFKHEIPNNFYKVGTDLKQFGNHMKKAFA